MENSFEGVSKAKQKQKNEEIEFHISIQDGGFTIVYCLQKSALKNAWT